MIIVRAVSRRFKVIMCYSKTANTGFTVKEYWKIFSAVMSLKEFEKMYNEFSICYKGEKLYEELEDYLNCLVLMKQTEVIIEQFEKDFPFM